MDYIEYLFVGPGNKPKESPLKNNLIHSVDSALTYVERRMKQGLNHWLVIAVNQQKGLSQARHPQFHVVRFIERACHDGRAIKLH